VGRRSIASFEVNSQNPKVSVLVANGFSLTFFCWWWWFLIVSERFPYLLGCEPINLPRYLNPKIADGLIIRRIPLQHIVHGTVMVSPRDPRCIETPSECFIDLAVKVGDLVHYGLGQYSATM
jgi:hypothetical protein